MNTSYKEIVAQDRRLAMLRFLEQDSDYKINDSVMQQALEQLGHSVSREAIRADFDFLAEIGLIEVETYFDGKVQVAKITGRGLDVAAGAYHSAATSGPLRRKFYDKKCRFGKARISIIPRREPLTQYSRAKAARCGRTPQRKLI